MWQRIMSCLLVGLCVVAIAADPPVKMINLVIVTKDGKRVTGEMVNADEAQIRIKPNPKSEEIVAINWEDVKAVSNGITRQKVIDDTKKLFPNRICETCHGGGTVKCEKCSGSGVDPASATDCESCHGTSAIGKCPKCKEGKMPCPDKCIKAEQFNGKAPDKDGKRWIRVNAKKGNGYTTISDAHIGDLFVFKEDGSLDLKGKCPTCNGTTLVECTLCHGTGNKDCPKCLAGKTGPPCGDCKEGKVPCKECEGLGLKKKAVEPNQEQK